MINPRHKHSLHPWHGVEPDWDNESLWGIVEIPKGEKAKYEVDKNSGLIKLDRSLRTAFEYPVNYGFIPRSLGEDGDPLDILVVSEISIQSLCLVRSKVLGVMEMIDQGKKDHKILAVALSDIRVAHIQSLAQLPEYLFRELRHFFTQYTVLESKRVEVHTFLELNEAQKLIDESLRRYNSHYGLAD